jgi:hypothetical protein
MEFLNIFSVDDLAATADVHLDRFADGRQWRDRAAAWLKSAKDGAEAARYAAENARLRDEIAALSAKMDAFMSGGITPSGRKPMAPEQREAAAARLRAGREAKQKIAEHRAAFAARMKAGRDAKKAEG